MKKINLIQKGLRIGLSTCLILSAFFANAQKGKLGISFYGGNGGVIFKNSEDLMIKYNAQQSLNLGLTGGYEFNAFMMEARVYSSKISSDYAQDNFSTSLSLNFRNVNIMGSYISQSANIRAKIGAGVIVSQLKSGIQRVDGDFYDVVKLDKYYKFPIGVVGEAGIIAKASEHLDLHLCLSLAQGLNNMEKDTRQHSIIRTYGIQSAIYYSF
jgi:hypothetical protein